MLCQSGTQSSRAPEQLWEDPFSHLCGSWILWCLCSSLTLTWAVVGGGPNPKDVSADTARLFITTWCIWEF